MTTGEYKRHKGLTKQNLRDKHLITSLIPSEPLSTKGLSHMRCLRNTSHTPPEHLI